MTYCIGVMVDEALVMLADTRTNAGIDNISCFRKLHIFEKPGDSVMVLATSGNLSVTQSVLSLLREGLENKESGELETLYDQPTMFKAAQFVGRAIREVWRTDGKSMEQQNTKFDIQILLGGQTARGDMRLFQIYTAGNFIEVTSETPYFQIGEHKYGKPIIDRAVSHDSDPYDVLKVCLISMDSTMRSNLGVGLPIDMIILPRHALQISLNHRIDHTDPYFSDLRERWSAALRAAHMAIPRPPYKGDTNEE